MKSPSYVDKLKQFLLFFLSVGYFQRRLGLAGYRANSGALSQKRALVVKNFGETFPTNIVE